MIEESTLQAECAGPGTDGAEDPSESFMPEAFEAGLVSVIIPAYNRRELIVEALDSVAAQTYRPIEVIVVDDGSIDGTAEVAEEWFKTLAALRRQGLDLRVVRQPNGGAPRARNRALVESRGEFIQFLDSDDLLAPQKLEVHLNHLRTHPGVDFVYSAAAKFGAAAIASAGRPYCGRESMTVRGHLSRKGSAINTYVGFYRRDLCRRVGPWDERLRVWQDGEYNLRMLLSDAQIAFLPGVLVHHRDYEGERVSGSYPAMKHVEALEIAFETLVARAQGDALGDGLACFADQCRSITFHAICTGRWSVADQALEVASRIDDGPWHWSLCVMLRWLLSTRPGRVLAARIGRRVLGGVRRLRALP